MVAQRIATENTVECIHLISLASKALDLRNLSERLVIYNGLWVIMQDNKIIVAYRYVR